MIVVKIPAFGIEEQLSTETLGQRLICKPGRVGNLSHRISSGR